LREVLYFSSKGKESWRERGEKEDFFEQERKALRWRALSGKRKSILRGKERSLTRLSIGCRKANASVER